MMATSLGGEALPEVCVNFGTATVVISCGDDVVKIETLAAAQHLHAQMEQAIAALGALDGR
jgi:phosphoketolase